MSDNITFPKIPVSNWYAIRKQFAKTLPSVVSQTYLQSLLKLGSAKSAQNFISPLKMMGIIDEECKPTDLANKWRNDATYAEACKEIFERVYPDELRQLFVGEDIDKEALTTWFMSTTKCGEAAAKLLSVTFMYLCNPSLEPSEKNTAKTSSISKSAKKIKREAREKNSETVTSNVMANDQQTSNTTRRPTVHIDLQIHISPDSSAEQVDAIFASIAKHLYDK